MATIALPRFLEKLRTITETTPTDIASWSVDGSQYEIHSPRFESEILTQHFDAKRSLLSFIRQVNLNLIPMSHLCEGVIIGLTDCLAVKLLRVQEARAQRMRVGDFSPEVPTGRTTLDLRD